MKKLFLAAGLALLLGLPTLAEPTPPSPRRGAMRQTLEELNLSADQKAQIQQIFENLPRGQRKDAIMKILTPEQQTQFKTKWAARRALRGTPSPSPSPGGENPTNN